MFLKLYATDNHHEKFLFTESTVEVDSTHTQFKKNVLPMTLIISQILAALM